MLADRVTKVQKKRETHFITYYESLVFWGAYSSLK